MQKNTFATNDGGSRIAALERDVYRVSRDVEQVQTTVTKMSSGFDSLATQVGNLVAMHKLEASKPKASPLTLLSIIVACIAIMGTVIALVEYDIKMISTTAIVPTTHTVDMLNERVKQLEAAIRWTPKLADDTKR
jgi:hypothetical protein